MMLTFTLLMSSFSSLMPFGNPEAPAVYVSVVTWSLDNIKSINTLLTKYVFR